MAEEYQVKINGQWRSVSEHEMRDLTQGLPYVIAGNNRVLFETSMGGTESTPRALINENMRTEKDGPSMAGGCPQDPDNVRG